MVVALSFIAGYPHILARVRGYFGVTSSSVISAPLLLALHFFLLSSLSTTVVESSIYGMVVSIHFIIANRKYLPDTIGLSDL